MRLCHTKMRRTMNIMNKYKRIFVYDFHFIYRLFILI